MAKDLNNMIEILDGDFSNIENLLTEGKTILAAVEIGEYVSSSLNKGFSDHFNANMELKEKKENIGICGCGKPANALIYIWRN
ncbi:hypothetical protein [Spiroplasma platyhelix]|uniref:Uncharacterized protein n=1 Tax=Spiroplasma platyhelix PALS-1 TaxID=1276218 RepID=A0A846U2L9_9MOLU|nr:hypothetical protein [Spiroplasma platyhelix]MBE4704397.1 hypothetical protein [Spiroplasma platyhelix PALS-1]NKE38769.1 hypothetical protein [Spiroplasma platyhelix PALS-1]UJB28980.1 hypothetical protein SPLAT_v1c02150 [Spiroplasma platyhelix PALS-1]